jgi:hypothetical protein
LRKLSVRTDWPWTTSVEPTGGRTWLSAANDAVKPTRHLAR